MMFHTGDGKAARAASLRVLRAGIGGLWLVGFLEEMVTNRVCFLHQWKETVPRGMQLLGCSCNPSEQKRLPAAFQGVLGSPVFSIVIWDTATTCAGFALGYTREKSRKGKRTNTCELKRIRFLR